MTALRSQASALRAGAFLLVGLAGSRALPAEPPDLGAAAVLPVPAADSRGEVPFSSPMAPVPSGLSPWAVSLSVLAGVADPFYGKVATTLSVRHGWGDAAFELYGGRAFSWSGPALSLCTSAANCTTPSASSLGSTPGNLGFIGGAAAVWRLAQGKLSLSGLAVGRFALEVSVGAAAVQYMIYDTAWHSIVAPGGRAGLALDASITNALTLRLDLQDYVYPTDIRGDHEVESQVLAGVTFAVGFGP